MQQQQQQHEWEEICAECWLTHVGALPHPCRVSNRRVMLWRRSDNVVFALLLGGAGLVAVGDGVECQVKGILQVGC